MPPAAAQKLTAVDRRYLNDLGRPVWLTVRSQIRLSAMYEGLPEQVLTPENANEMQRVREDLNRAESLPEELGYQPRNLSPDVREYGRYIEDMVRLVRDAHREVALMFSKIDMEGETYATLGDTPRHEINRIYYGVGESWTASSGICSALDVAPAASCTAGAAKTGSNAGPAGDPAFRL